MPSPNVAAVAALFVSAFVVAGCGEPRAPAPSPPPVVAPSASSPPIPPGVEGLADTAAPPSPSVPPSASPNVPPSGPGADGAECDARHPCAAGLSCVYPCGIPGCTHRCTAAPPASPPPRSR